MIRYLIALLLLLTCSVSDGATIHYLTAANSRKLAGVTPTPYTLTLLDDADATAARSTLGLVIGTNVQAQSSVLNTYAGINPSANVQSLLGAADYSAVRALLSLVPGTNVQTYDSDLTIYAGITPSANMQTFLGSANFADMRSNLGLVPGTDVQAFSSVLSTYSSINPSANVQTILGAADYSAIRTALSLVPGTNIQIQSSALTSWASVTRSSGFDSFTTTPSVSNFFALVTGEGSGVESAFSNSVNSAGGFLTYSGIGSVVQAYDADLDDLADGSLTGSKVGFADTDNLFTATNVQAALEELNDSINGGDPNGSGAKVHWSQILGVPAGFADGVDNTGGGGGSSADEITFTPAGTIAATDVQAAIEELDTEKQTQNAGLQDIADIFTGTPGENFLFYYDESDNEIKLVDFASGDLDWQDDSLVIGQIDHDLNPSSANTLFLGADGAEWAAVFVTDEAYHADDWNGSESVPTKNAVRDVVVTLQPLHANLTAFSGLSLIADRLPYANGSGTLALATFTSTGRDLVAASSASAARDVLGASSGVFPATVLPDATTSAKGVAEIAVASEINTGSDTGRVISPNELRQADIAKWKPPITLHTDKSTLTTGNGKAYFGIPPLYNGWKLIAIYGWVETVSSSGSPTFMVRRNRSGADQDMLTTGVTFDANEKTLSTSSAASGAGYVIDTSGGNDTIQTDDLIYIDCDVAGTGTKLPQLVLVFQKP